MGGAPAYGEVPLESEAHGEVGGPGHQDVLHRVPQVGEGQGVGQRVHLKHLVTGGGRGADDEDLDHGVVHDAGDDVEGVHHGEGHEQLVEGGAHLRGPGGPLIHSCSYRRILSVIVWSPQKPTLILQKKLLVLILGI